MMKNKCHTFLLWSIEQVKQFSYKLNHYFGCSREESYLFVGLACMVVFCGVVEAYFPSLLTYLVGEENLQEAEEAFYSLGGNPLLGA